MKILAKIERITDKAYLLDIGGAKHWLPQSQVKRGVANGAGLEEVEIADWLARKSGITQPTEWTPF